jgi:multiple sugar transport system substrate-binding protein
MLAHGIGFSFRTVRFLLVGAVFLAACSPAAQPAAQPQATPNQAAAQQTQAPAAASGGNLVFFSTQFAPVEEQAKMQNIILKDAPAKADFIPSDTGPFNDRMDSEQKTSKVTVSLIGGLHGDLDPFVKAGYLEDLSSLAQKLSDRGLAPAFMDLARMGTKDKTYYIPWMQATYVLAINKKAMPYCRRAPTSTR